MRHTGDFSALLELAGVAKAFKPPCASRRPGSLWANPDWTASAGPHATLPLPQPQAAVWPPHVLGDSTAARKEESDRPGWVFQDKPREQHPFCLLDGSFALKAAGKGL